MAKHSRSKTNETYYWKRLELQITFEFLTINDMWNMPGQL